MKNLRNFHMTYRNATDGQTTVYAKSQRNTRPSVASNPYRIARHASANTQ